MNICTNLKNFLPSVADMSGSPGKNGHPGNVVPSGWRLSPACEHKENKRSHRRMLCALLLIRVLCALNRTWWGRRNRPFPLQQLPTSCCSSMGLAVTWSAVTWSAAVTKLTTTSCWTTPSTESSQTQNFPSAFLFRVDYELDFSESTEKQISRRGYDAVSPPNLSRDVHSASCPRGKTRKFSRV